jgi:transposase InsO family protein
MQWDWFLFLIFLWAVVVSVVLCMDEGEPEGHAKFVSHSDSDTAFTSADLQAIREDDERLAAGIRASLGMTDSVNPPIDAVSKNK